MARFILLTEKSWHKALFVKLKKHFEDKNEWILINETIQFNKNNLDELKPVRIFIPHWSYIIPDEIFNSFECIVFHMTDLPYGRGGSPLQNLIVEGKVATKISAIKVDKGIDEGDIYLKRELSLGGTAEEIFIRASDSIYEIILEIIEKDLKPLPQIGEPIIFKRRKPKDSNISDLDNITKVYDHIRMLDAEGYPNAFIETGGFRFEFTRASLKTNDTILADVRISKK